MSTVIRFSDPEDPNPDSVEVSETTENPSLPHQTIPEHWKEFLQEEGVQVPGIEWWEAPNPIKTFGFQGYSQPMIISVYLWIIPVLLISAFPISLLGIGILRMNEQIRPIAVSGFFIVFGIVSLVGFIVAVHFISQFGYSIGGLGRYFYGVNARSLIIAYKPFPIPFLKTPAKVTSIRFDNKYFLADVRWNGTGSLVVPQSQLDEVQLRTCTSGMNGFLYVKNIHELVSLVHTFSSGTTEVTPDRIPYAKLYARVLVLVSLFWLLMAGVYGFLVLYVFYWVTALFLESFLICYLTLALFTFWYAFYWWNHQGLIHLNCPPNIPIFPRTIFSQFKEAVSSRFERTPPPAA